MILYTIGGWSFEMSSMRVPDEWLDSTWTDEDSAYKRMRFLEQFEIKGLRGWTLSKTEVLNKIHADWPLEGQHCVSERDRELQARLNKFQS